MNCLICRQAELVDGLTSITFESGEMKFVVNKVPARVCPRCGDACVDEVVAVRLLQGVEGLSAAGAIEDVREYEEL